MTLEQFEALRRWIDARVHLSAMIANSPNDHRFVIARLRELEYEDEQAKMKLVDNCEGE